MMKTSRKQPLLHYTWGNDCDGWVLVDEKDLSVKQELMPPGSFEKKHYHEKAQQYFFILSGRARFEIANQLIEVPAGEGIRISPGTIHRIINDGDEVLEFLVSSQPSTNNDRVLIE